MKHLKKHPVKDPKNQVSTDMKKQDHVKPKKEEKMDGEKSLAKKPTVPKKSNKPSNKKLDGEKFLAKDEKPNARKSKPSNKKLDGEKFLAEDDKLEEVPAKVLKNLKKFNEELKSWVYDRAGRRLRKLGQEDRADKLQDWSKHKATIEERENWEECVRDSKKYGEFKISIQNPNTNESVVGNFYLSLHFDETSWQEIFDYDDAGVWFQIGIIPTTWELQEQVASIASDDDMSNGFFWAMNFGLKFKHINGEVEYGESYLCNYDEYIIGNVKMVDIKGVRMLKKLLSNLFDNKGGDLGYPSGYTNADTLTEVLQRSIGSTDGFTLESVADAIRKISANQLFASQSK